MSKTMLVNVTHVEESRVAILEDGVLSTYEIETINRTHLKGNIHNAVVESVHANLEAAFVRIGPELKGFLPLDEVNFRLLPSRTDSRKAGRIGQHLHPGQKLMAQVVREPFAGKPPTVSTYFSLPGRYLVLMPGVDSSGISRKIEESKQRDRLKKIVQELKAPEGFGVIVRTAGVGQTKTELQRDLRYLLRLWESIQRASAATEFPGLVYREADLVIRMLRDHLTPDVSEVWIDSKEVHDKALAFAGDVMPKRARAIKLYTGDRPLFNKYNLEEQIERIYKRRVPLASGGEIVIDGTEALTAIDVNSARSRKSSDLEESVLQTNLEAAEEAALQLRLRDVGGLVVVDFIDMATAKNRNKVEKCMRDAMRSDKAKADITRISKLGLMEIARQRIRGAKLAASYATCRACDGYGLVKNVETAALAALRKLHSRASRGSVGRIRLKLPPDVAVWLLNNKRGDLSALESAHRVGIEIEPSETLLRHETEFETFAPEKPEDSGDTVRPGRATEAVAEAPAPVEPPAQSEARPAATRRRSRGSRRGAGETRPAQEPSEATPAKATEPDRQETPPRDDEKVVPFAPRESTGPTAEGGAETGNGEKTEGRPRRRRRRRRGRGGGGGASASTEAGGPVEAPVRTEPPTESERTETPNESERTEAPNKSVRTEAPKEPAVPRGVRSDELMPAADPRRGGARRGGSGRGRRSKTSGRGGRGEG